MIPFVRDFDPRPGRPVRATPLIERVTADNPGPFTFTGTNTFIVGTHAQGATLAVVDPGPDDPAHLKALLSAVRGRRVSHVLVTHTHSDHAPLARPFADAVGAQVLAAAPPPRQTHASAGLDADEDVDFRPDRILADGDVVNGPDWTLRVVATPGHASNHLAFALEEENALFCGDHVMGWSTTVVAPPDGDMTDYMLSLRRVSEARYDVLWPTHGGEIRAPAFFLEAYRDHRLMRDAQILERLELGDSRIADMVPHLYSAVDRRLWPAASLSVWAHLIAMVRDGRATADPSPELDALYSPG
jgi:glyoxylase-like metal-dependent hydrolase (beta-lactamase superfamily II)